LRARAFHEDEAGFTIVELMVVMATIGVLSMMAIPTFLTAKEREMDRSAQSDLQVALSAAKAMFTDDQDYTGLTIADFAAAEPNVGWVASGAAPAPVNDYSVSMRVWNYGEINVARLSESGVCFYLRTIDVQRALGHRSAGFTLSVYAHLFDAHLDELASALDETSRGTSAVQPIVPIAKKSL
jgi:prepilin-type N-terminal cleavage/methylation domain-containing protein